MLPSPGLFLGAGTRKAFRLARCSNTFSRFPAGNKGKRSTNRDEGDDDDAASTGTTDTYGSVFDQWEVGTNNAASESRGGEAAGAGESSSSKAVDDFKDGVEMLTEKR